MTHYSRADWGARPANLGPGNLTPSRVEGIAAHWPAMSSPLTSADAVKAALRSWQNYHLDGHGWSDIAYQVAIDQQGNRYDLRGLATQSGANGDSDVNERYGAMLLVLAPGEEPTDAMIREVRAVVADHRKLFPHSTKIVGHADIRPEPTSCPGPAALRLIRAGAFEPQEDDMALDKEALEKIADAVWAKQIGGDDNRKPATLHLLWASNAARRAAAAALDAEKVAKAVVALMPAGGDINEATVVAGVKKALAQLVNEEK